MSSKRITLPSLGDIVVPNPQGPRPLMVQPNVSGPIFVVPLNGSFSQFTTGPAAGGWVSWAVVPPNNVLTGPPVGSPSSITIPWANPLQSNDPPQTFFFQVVYTPNGGTPTIIDPTVENDPPPSE